MDLSKIGRWDFTSKVLGDLVIRPYSFGTVKKLSPLLEQDPPDESEIIQALFAACARRVAEADEEALVELTEEEIAKQDLDHFADEFLDQNSYLFSTKTDGEVSFNLERGPEETSSAFLVRAIKEYQSRQLERFKEAFSLPTRMQDLSNSLNQGSALQSVAKKISDQNARLTDFFRPTEIGLSSRPHSEPYIPKIPPNPVHDTNRHLEQMTARFDELLEFGQNTLEIMTGLQGAAAEFLDKFTKEAKANSRAARAAIFVGGLAVVISIVQIAYTEFWRVPRDTASMDAYLELLQIEIDQLQSAQIASSADLQTNLTAAMRTNAAVWERLETLLQEQASMNSEMAGVLREIADNLDRPMIEPQVVEPQVIKPQE